MLDLPAPRIRAYPKETVISEKLQAMVTIGMANSRMKDFYDLWLMSKQFSFNGQVLTRAIKATFDRRQSSIPRETPLALSMEFADNREKVFQWQGFLGRTALSDNGTGLAGVVEDLFQFLQPPLLAAAGQEDFTLFWPSGGPWV